MPQREERIKRNNAILEQLGVRKAAQNVAAGQRRRASQQRKPKAAVQSIIRKCARLRKGNQTAPKKENLKALESGKLGTGHRAALMQGQSFETQHLLLRFWQAESPLRILIALVKDMACEIYMNSLSHAQPVMYTAKACSMFKADTHLCHVQSMMI